MSEVKRLSVREIRADRESGMTIQKMAEKHGISAATMKNLMQQAGIDTSTRVKKVVLVNDEVPGEPETLAAIAPATVRG